METKTLEDAIEKAFRYRGNVTIAFRNGHAIDGFIFNREFQDPKRSEEPFIEVFLVKSGDYQKYPIATLQSITFTGEDHAAGKSYHEWLAKQQTKSAS